MRSTLHVASTITLGLFVAVTTTGLAQRGRTPPASSAGSAAEATARIVAAAQAVLTSLDEAGRAKVQFPFEGPQKTKWSNFPSGIFQREGVKLADLTAPQRAAIDTLLSTSLSADGYRKVHDIMRADGVLGRGQGGGGRGPGGGGPPPGAGGPPPGAGGPPPGGGGPPPGGGGPPGAGGRGGGRGGGGNLRFSEDEYFLAFLGTPSTTAPWMLQFGGHHLAINLTMAGSQATMAPSLPAAQPAVYEFEGRTIRPLGAENDKAFALINALNDTQRAQAIIGSRVADLVLGPGQDGKTIQPEGIRAPALTAAQQTMLLDIVREWTGIQHDAFGEPRMAEIKTNLPDTWFAWSGPTTNGSAAYFRIQGPTLVIEYAPQGGVDHIHTIYRDPTNDYGAKFTRK
jgi:hypothetical protein